MRPRTLVFLLPLLVAAAYLIWRVTGGLLGFLAFYVATMITLAGFAALFVAFPASDLVARLAGREVRKAPMARIRLAVLVSFVFLCVAALVTNVRWLPDRRHPVSLVSDAIIVALSVALAWCLIRPSARRVVVWGASALSSALAIVVLVALMPHGPPASAPSPVEALETLGYLTWVPAERSSDSAGVVHHDPDRAFQGLNFYSSRNLPSAFLMDMEGNIVHEWTVKTGEDDKWAHVELCANGDVLAALIHEKLLRVSWDSEIVWSVDLSIHHDMELTPEGEIYALTDRDEFASVSGLPAPIINNYLTVFTPPGGAARHVSLLEIAGDRVPLRDPVEIYRWLCRPRGMRALVAAARDTERRFQGIWPVDIFHSNAAEVIHRNVDEIFREGNILLCVRNLNLVCVYDPGAGELIWSWGPGELEGPHHPNLLDNGNLLVFDNGVARHYSRIVEVDPRKRAIVWEYVAEPKHAFYSATRGSCQRLPNGNTLITDSDNGHVFEVTGDGEIVWEFYNPVIHERFDSRAAIYRMLRFRRDHAGLERLRGSRASQNSQ